VLKALGTTARRLALGLAWAVVLVASFLTIVEESGVLARGLRASVAWRLGPLGEGLEVGAVRLRWFEPGIELQGLRLRTVGEDGRADEDLLHVRRLHVSLGASWRDQPLRRLHVDGGKIRVSEGLLDALNRFAESWRDREETPAVTPPPFVITGFEVELELPDEGIVEVGTVDLRAVPRAEGGFELTGELTPTLAGAVTERAPIHVRGRQDESGVFLRATADGIPLRTASLEVPPSFGSPPVEEFEGRLSLDATGRVELGEEAVVSASVRARLFEARLLPAPGQPWVDDLAVDVEATFEPALDEDLWQRDSWDAVTRVRANWHGTPLLAWAELGERVPGGNWARCFARAEELPLDEETLRVLGAMENSGVREAWEAFSPRGSVDASIQLVLDRREGLDGGPARYGKRLALHLRHTAAGRSGLTFHGFPELLPDDRTGERMGIAMPCDGIVGQTVFTFDEALARPWHVALVDLEAQHASGTVTGWAGMAANPPGSELEEPELDLAFTAPDIEIDEKWREVLMTSYLTRQIYHDYNPAGGTFSSGWRFRNGPETDGLSAAGWIRVEGVDAAWAGLPIPVPGITGELELLWAERASRIRDLPGRVHRPWGVSWSLDNAGSTEQHGVTARVSGFARMESAPPEVDRAAVTVDPTWALDIEIDELLLRGRDADILAGVIQEFGEQRDSLGARGGVHVTYESARAHPSQPYVACIEASPTVVEVSPKMFPRRTRDVEGRLLVHWELDDEDVGSVSSSLDMAGLWPEGVELAASADLPAEGEGLVVVHGSGLDPDNTAFRGAVQEVLAESNPGMQGIDTDGSWLEGAIDVVVRSTFPIEPPEGSDAEVLPENEFRYFLRGASLSNGSLLLEDLQGTLEQSSDILSSPRIEATVAGHPLVLEDVLAFPIELLDEVPGVDPLFSSRSFLDPRGMALQARLSTTGLPLDDVMRLLDPAVIEEAEGEAFPGTLDVLGAHVLITSAESDGGEVVLHGPMRPHDVGLSFGLPLEIATADIDLHELVLERGSVRAWAEIENLDAAIAGRELTGARMILGIVDRRLTIDDLEGDFELGTLRSLGGQGRGSHKALGVDLQEPHRFDLALEMEDVHVDRLLRGVFQSSIADEGLLDGSLQLSGALDDVLALSGRGALRLDGGRLWSIPAMRVLFSQLGFPNTAVFDRLRTRFELRDGTIDTHHLEVKSSLLNLVGSGRLDLTGLLDYELDVRYSLVDRLGILNRLIYWLNRNLVRVTVQGDFWRPQVQIRSAIMELFRGRPDDPRRGLPLPDFAPLPPRF
jgi:hypothetical protein